MKLFLAMLLLTSSLSFTSLNAQDKAGGQKRLPLMPYPSSVNQSDGQFRLDTSLVMVISGESSKLERYARRSFSRLLNQTALFIPKPHIISSKTEVPEGRTAFQISFSSSVQPQLERDESNQLSVTESGIELEATTDIGAMRGLETMLQLIQSDSAGFYLPAVEIEDSPRFAWRGLLMDVSRHFMPVGVVKRTLNTMASVKMNVLHWHLTDDQGFRVESKTFPELHEQGSRGNYYTQEQIRDIINYAADRGIRVIPEFDMPGHATSWLVSHPELGSAPGSYELETRWGIHDPVFNPTQEETYEFLDKFFAEMAQLFPDQYMHIGGDENNGKHWAANDQIQKFMEENGLEDKHQMQAYFTERVNKILDRYGKTMIGWDEIFEADIPNDIVVQSWRGKKSLYEAANQGFPVILSNGYYIDLCYTTEKHYLNDPLPSDTLVDEGAADNIMGGEATMWAELVTPDNVDTRIWPRTAAIAERFWSSREIDDVNDMYRRLEAIEFHLEEAGSRHNTNYTLMLRRVARSHDIEAIKTLVDILEPIKRYTRHRQTKDYRTYSPYTRVVDAARPDARVARNFNAAVEDFLEEPTYQKRLDLEVQLLRWKSNHEDIVALAENAPMVAEVVPVSESVRQMAVYGLDWLKMAEQGKKLSSEQYQSHKKWLEMQKFDAQEVEIIISTGIEKLLKAVSPGN